MKKWYKWAFFVGIVTLSFGFYLLPNTKISPTDNVEEVLVALGQEPAPHQVNFDIPGVSAVRGEEIALMGVTIDTKGKKTSIQSKYFNCNACHNIEREEHDLAHPNPQRRLEYTVQKDLPFLQGSPLYGIVNRRKFYNDDYFKKYGDLVEDARDDLRGAIQLCAVECSQGRSLNTWEMESVLAYLWSLQLKMGDLLLTEVEKKQIEAALDGQGDKDKAADLIRSKYVQGYPATFVYAPPDRKKGNGLEGSPENGKLIHQQSCMYCHYDKEFSFLRLDDSPTSLKYLAKKAKTYHRHSSYQVIRYGTSPKAGKKAYMPQYPLEKLSEQQLADLISYYNSSLSK